MNFNDMSIAKLREFAKANGIKLQSATKKADIVAILEEATQSQPTLEVVTEQEVVRSGAEDSREIREEASEEAKLQQRLMQEEIADQKPALTDETVCVYSERRYSSTKLGRLDLGYNIVTKKNGMIWVRLPDVRPATKEELARAMSSGVKPGQKVGAKGRRM